MARIRTIKPEICESESLSRCSRDARLLFILLWTVADDEGRLRGNSRLLANSLFPYDDDARALIDHWLEELSVEKCIRRYEVEGNQYIDIPKWREHQKIDRPSDSKFPAFDEDSTNVRRGFDEDSTRARASRGSKTRTRKGPGKEGTKEGTNCARPSFDDWKLYATEQGMSEQQARSTFDHYETVGWVYGKNKTPIKDWKACVRTCRNREKEASQGAAASHKPHGPNGKPKPRELTREEFIRDRASVGKLNEVPNLTDEEIQAVLG